MEIKDKKLYEFSFSEEEQKALENACNVLDKLLQEMRANSYKYIKSGYEDWCQKYSCNEIETIKEQIEDIASAWEIGK